MEDWVEDKIHSRFGSQRFSVVEMRHAWSDANTMGGAITHAAILKMLVSDAKDLIHPENASAPVEMDITARKERNSVVYALRAVLPVKAPLQSVPVVTLSDFVKVKAALHHVDRVSMVIPLIDNANHVIQDVAHAQTEPRPPLVQLAQMIDT